MPHPATHITIVQRLAQSDPAIAAALGSPDPNFDPKTGQAGLAAVRKMRFASLGAVGPDIFYFLADFRQPLQDVEDLVVKAAATFAAIEEVGEALHKVQTEIDKEAAVITCGLSSVVGQLTGQDGLAGTAQLLGANVSALLQMLAIDAGFNPISILEPPRQQDEPREKWFWADYLHYAHTGDFTRTLLQKSRLDPKYKDHPHLLAYALGYLTHYVTDVVGHPYVNQIVQAPYRLYWQRHALVENFIDGYVWDRWHKKVSKIDPSTGKEVEDPVTGEVPLDRLVPASSPNFLGTGAPLLRARLHDLIDCGGAEGIDPIDKFLEGAAEVVLSGLGSFAGLHQIELTDDADFELWTQFMADCIQTTYGAIEHPHRLEPNDGLPTAENIASAYSVCRFFLKLISEESIHEPVFPKVGDLSEALKKLWDDLENDLGAIPSPPSLDGGGKFDFHSFWNKVKAWAHFIAEAAAAIAKAAVDLVDNACKNAGEVGRDVVKMAFYLVHKALWAIYQALRETLVFAAYAQPNMEQVKAMTDLWKSPGNMAEGRYPVEEYLHDGELPQTKLWSDYSPLVVPETQDGATVEQPPVTFAAPFGAGSSPDAFLDAPQGPNDMFAGPMDKGGTIGPTQDEIVVHRPDEQARHSFTDRALDYGGAIANCARAIKAILNQPAQDAGQLPIPLANFNLDGDRGYGWPSWDAETSLHPTTLNPANVSAVPWAD